MNVAVICVGLFFELALAALHRSRYRIAHLDMLLEILWTLKGLAAEVALVRLQRHVDANV